MKYIKSAIVIAFVCIQANTVQAQWVVVAPTTDALTMVKNIKDAVFQCWDQVSKQYNWAVQLYDNTRNYANQIAQIQHQYEQITQMATAIKGIDPSTLSTLRSSLQNTYEQTNTLMGKLHGMNDDVASVQSKFQSAYPTLDAMAKLDPVGWKAIVDRTSKEQVDNIYNAKIQAANIQKMNDDMHAKIVALSTSNDEASNKGNLVAAVTLGNRIALQQQQLILAQNANLALMLKQNGDNMNHLTMLHQAMQLEADKSFKYTPVTANPQGAGLFYLK